MSLIRECLPFYHQLNISHGFPRATSGKEHACYCMSRKRLGFDPWVGKIPWRREWQSILVFLAGECCGWRSLAGNSPGGCKESDMTERLSTQSCLTLSDPMDCSLPGFSVHALLHARILEWIAIPFSRESSQPDRKSTRLNSSHTLASRMPSSA